VVVVAAAAAAAAAVVAAVPLGRKAPSPEKKKAVSEDQEGCGQTSQQNLKVTLQDEVRD